MLSRMTLVSGQVQSLAGDVKALPNLVLLVCRNLNFFLERRP